MDIKKTGKRGGVRPGAGRKKGSINKTTVLRQAITRGGLNADLSPLSIMLEAMRDAYAKGDLHSAFCYAKDCATFCHPKLATVTASVNIRRADEMTTDELVAELREMGVHVEGR